MQTALKILGGLVAAIVLILIVVVVGARFSDGPVAIIAGGPFTSGELYSGPEPDWSFVEDVQEVEFQLLEPARSRTTWILHHGGKIFIPCGYMTSTFGKIWKQWPHEAEKDPRAILRIDDRLYERKLIRVTGGPAVEPVLARLAEKYPVGEGLSTEALTSGSLWLFELAPRD